MLDRKLYFVQVCRAAQGNAKCWGLQGHQAYTYQLVSPRIHNTAESELLCVSKHVVSALHLSAGSSFQYTSAWLWDRCSNQGECLIKKGNICHKQRRGLWLTYQTAHIAKGWSIYQWACVPQLALQCLESKRWSLLAVFPLSFSWTASRSGLSLQGSWMKTGSEAYKACPCGGYCWMIMDLMRSKLQNKPVTGNAAINPWCSSHSTVASKKSSLLLTTACREIANSVWKQAPPQLKL